MKHLFWLRPGLIAGRTGPDIDPWDPPELSAAGVGAILSVNDARSVYPEDLELAGIEHAHFPLSDNAPPRPGDFEYCLQTLPRAYAYIVDVIEDGRIPLIHCSSGKDRTGLTLCHYLCRRERYSPRAAVDEVRRVRPIALSATGYESFAIDVLDALGRG